MRIRDRSPSVSFDRKFDTRFSPSETFSRRRRSSSDRWDGQTGYLSLPLILLLPLPLLYASHRKGKLVRWLVPVVHSLRNQDRRSMHQREEQSRRQIASSSAASKTKHRPEQHTKKANRFSSSSSLELLLRHRFQDQLGHCGLDGRLRIHLCLKHGNNRELRRRSGSRDGHSFRNSHCQRVCLCLSREANECVNYQHV